MQLTITMRNVSEAMRNVPLSSRGIYGFTHVFLPGAMGCSTCTWTQFVYSYCTTFQICGGRGGRGGPVNVIYVSQLNVGKVIGKGQSAPHPHLLLTSPSPHTLCSAAGAARRLLGHYARRWSFGAISASIGGGGARARARCINTKRCRPPARRRHRIVCRARKQHKRVI